MKKVFKSVQKCSSFSKGEIMESRIEMGDNIESMESELKDIVSSKNENINTNALLLKVFDMMRNIISDQQKIIVSQNKTISTIEVEPPAPAITKSELIPLIAQILSAIKPQENTTNE